jgi:hypothetical protein
VRRFSQIFLVFILLAASLKAFGQKRPEILLIAGASDTLLTEKNIVSWDWRHQSLIIDPLAASFLKLHTVQDSAWTLQIGNAHIATGFFADAYCSDCRQAVPLIMLKYPRKILSIHPGNILFLYFITYDRAERQLQDTLPNPLDSPVLLSHLIDRRLISTEDRLKSLLDHIGLACLGKWIQE